MTHDPVRALARVLQTALRHHHTVERAATVGLVRGAWRHSTDAERAALDPDGPGNLHAALQRLQEGAPW